MKKAFIAQARMTSSRLPGKVAKDICGKPSLYRMIERMRLSKHDMDIVIATTTNHQDDIVEEIANDCGVKVFRGSEQNVLSRYYYAAKEFGIDIIDRVTCDDLLNDPRWMFDTAMDMFLEDGTYDYFNICGPNPCCGCGCEIFTFEGIERCFKEATHPYCIEHVTPYFYKNPHLFNLGSIETKYDGPNIFPRIFGTTLDTEEDLILLRKIYEALYPNNPKFGTMDVVNLLIEHPDWQKIVEDVPRTPVTYHGELNDH